MMKLITNLGLIEEKEKLVSRMAPPVTPLDDFPYKGIFQVSMKLLKQQTGLNFKWKGVTPIKVEESTTKLKRMDATETPNEAHRGAAPFLLQTPIILWVLFWWGRLIEILNLDIYG